MHKVPRYRHSDSEENDNYKNVYLGQSNDIHCHACNLNSLTRKLALQVMQMLLCVVEEGLSVFKLTNKDELMSQGSSSSANRLTIFIPAQARQLSYYNQNKT
jgi:hypothetical protein